jgi:cysteinyl-tRNA synthetase
VRYTSSDELSSMSLSLYSTLARKKTAFAPLEPQRVTMYCCGVTVYDDCHLGHARSYIGWDVVRRYLRWRGYQVRYVQNFTDIDDKILQRAEREGSSMQAVADRYIAAYFQDMRRLNILDADEYPRVTEHVPAICDLIQVLVDRGYAYAANGDVYYSVRRYADYGKLSGRRLEQLQAGAGGRVDAADHERGKQDPFDFALWKAAKPGEPAWDSPWGAGRPGWHIECSAMIRARLGETIDIHGGGGDLVFPHHENEIAQSEVVSDRLLANYWLHNGMVTVNGEKMSKSLGNFTTIQALLDGDWPEYPQPIDPMAVRLFVLQAHYRKPLDFTPVAIAAATQGWQTLKSALTLDWTKLPDLPKPTELATEFVDRFIIAMDDDLNTAAGLAVLFELAKSLKREFNSRVDHDRATLTDVQLCQRSMTLMQLAQVLGLEGQATDSPLSEEIEPVEVDPIWVEELIQQRQQARQENRYGDSDRIREELQTAGITLIDQSDGQTRWHKQLANRQSANL